jgi:hypothetical protein
MRIYEARVYSKLIRKLPCVHEREGHRTLTTQQLDRPAGHGFHVIGAKQHWGDKIAKQVVIG